MNIKIYEHAILETERIEFLTDSEDKKILAFCDRADERINHDIVVMLHAEWDD